MTRILPFDDGAIAEAARLIGEGQPVAIATETVYGLAADATNAAAVARIYEAKGRPSFNPLIVHVADFQAAEQIGSVHRVPRIPQGLRKGEHPFGQPACVMEKQDLSHSHNLLRRSDSSRAPGAGYHRASSTSLLSGLVTVSST